MILRSGLSCNKKALAGKIVIFPYFTGLYLMQIDDCFHAARRIDKLRKVIPGLQCLLSENARACPFKYSRVQDFRLNKLLKDMQNICIKKFYLSGCIFSKKIYLILCWNL